MKLTFKSLSLLAVFFATMITSLWPNNIYILTVFAILCLTFLPLKKWWDDISIALVIFSLFYCVMMYANDAETSGFVTISIFLAPVAFYRFGRWITESIVNDNSRLIFLFCAILCYLIPLLVLTITDIQLGGFPSENRMLLSDIVQEDDTLSATLYGLMCSVGIGFISSIFIPTLKIYQKIILLIIPAICMTTVLHLTNRTGLVVFATCVIFSFIYATKMKPSKIVYSLIILCVISLIIIKSGVINEDVLNSYVNREQDASYSTMELGGRSTLWGESIEKLFTHPFGWNRRQYAHNLWLDIAAVGGWFPLIPFVIASYKAVKCLFNTLKQKTTAYQLILSTIFISMLCNSMVEPVVEGSILFLGLFIMVWGMLKAISQRATSANINYVSKQKSII